MGLTRQNKARLLLQAIDEFLIKATTGDPLWRRLHRIADQAGPELQKKILEVIAQTIANVDQAALERALARGDAEAAMKAIPWQEAADPQLRAAYQAICGEAYARAGAATADVLDRQLHDVGVSFNLENPRATAWAETVGAARVRDVSDETVDALRSIIGRGFREGVHPHDMARIIRGVRDPETGQFKSGLIGLNERQAQAVWNYRSALEEDENRPDTREEWNRIDRMVERYRDKLVLSRAETIARTETMQASNEGQQELWRQAREAGYLRGDERRIWIATPSERTCQACLDMDGQVVGLDEPFDSEDEGEIMVPPLHPACRCSVSLYADKSEGD